MVPPVREPLRQEDTNMDHMTALVSTFARAYHYRNNTSHVFADPLAEKMLTEDGETRYFQVQGKPHDPGELGHFLVYRVLERRDLE